MDILSIFSLNFTYALTVGDALNIYSLSVTIFFLLINPIPFGGTGSSLILIAVRYNLLAFHPFIVPSTHNSSLLFPNIYGVDVLLSLLLALRNTKFRLIFNLKLHSDIPLYIYIYKSPYILIEIHHHMLTKYSTSYRNK